MKVGIIGSGNVDPTKNSYGYSHIIWLGNRGHGQGGSSKGYRTFMYIVVYSRFYSQSMDTCF